MRIFTGRTIVLLIILSIWSCAVNNMSESKSIVTPLSDKASVPGGSLIYALPVTIFDIAIETERIIEKPGPYSRYAEDMLGLKDFIRDEREYWSIKGITIKTHDEPDPDGFYIIQTSNLFHTNALALKNAGLILDLNPELYNNTFRQEYGSELDFTQLQVLDLGADEYFRVNRDTAFRLINLDTAFVRIPYLVEKKQKLTSEQLAERAARRLMELRDGKHFILTGEANVFPQNEASILEMNRLEKEYTELFVGKILKESKIFNYQLKPDKELAGKSVTLLKFSEITGPGLPDDNSGNPVIVEFVPEQVTRNLVTVSGKRSGSSSVQYDKLFYRMPDVVNIKITYGNEVLCKSRRLIYQFGEILQLPSNFIIGK